jgi:prophage endopeptidase
MISLPDVIPTSWKIGAALALAAALAAAGSAYRHHVYQQGFEAAVDQRAARDGVAIATRVKGNVDIGIKQDALNKFLTKDKDEKLNPVVQRIYVDRVRIGTASCGPAAATKTDDASSGDGADSPGRLVREDVERDTRALTEAVELDLATGRTCQAWGKANGFWP